MLRSGRRASGAQRGSEEMPRQQKRFESHMMNGKRSLVERHKDS